MSIHVMQLYSNGLCRRPFKLVEHVAEHTKVTRAFLVLVYTECIRVLFKYLIIIYIDKRHPSCGTTKFVLVVRVNF